MIRRCDGTDPYLIRDVRPGEEPCGSWPDSVSCDCGLVFDDVNRSTVYPHTKLQPRLTEAEIDRLAASCLPHLVDE